MVKKDFKLFVDKDLSFSQVCFFDEVIERKGHVCGGGGGLCVCGVVCVCGCVCVCIYMCLCGERESAINLFAKTQPKNAFCVSN